MPYFTAKFGELGAQMLLIFTQPLQFLHGAQGGHQVAMSVHCCMYSSVMYSGKPVIVLPLISFLIFDGVGMVGKLFWLRWRLEIKSCVVPGNFTGSTAMWRTHCLACRRNTAASQRSSVVISRRCRATSRNTKASRTILWHSRHRWGSFKFLHRLSVIIYLLCTAVTKATGYINQEKIRIHNYAKMQHMLEC